MLCWDFWLEDTLVAHGKSRQGQPPQQSVFAVLRLLPGGADPAHWTATLVILHVVGSALIQGRFTALVLDVAQPARQKSSREPLC